MVTNDNLEKQLRNLIEPIVEDMGIKLDNIELAKGGNKLLLRIFIDREGGVTLDDCERVSREVGIQLDVEGIIPSSYILEVSSPGLDRPLRKPEDFRRFSGRVARVVTYKPIDNQTFFIGEIIEAGDTDIVLLLPKGKKVTIAYEDISRARLVYDPFGR
ncbi:MAG: ribosome maturation factor RimP [Nitrospirae bacterium]|nr:ribosome maturation factor RimP [Nitrospirota bacterium]